MASTGGGDTPKVRPTVADERTGTQAIKPGSLERVALWEAINAYVRSCGGGPDRVVYGNTTRQKCVEAVELAASGLRGATGDRQDAARRWGERHVADLADPDSRPFAERARYVIPWTLDVQDELAAMLAGDRTPVGQDDPEFVIDKLPVPVTVVCQYTVVHRGLDGRAVAYCFKESEALWIAMALDRTEAGRGPATIEACVQAIEAMPQSEEGYIARAAVDIVADLRERAGQTGDRPAPSPALQEIVSSLTPDELERVVAMVRTWMAERRDKEAVRPAPVDRQARLNGMGMEREAALRAEVARERERAERAEAAVREEREAYDADLARATAALRTKVQTLNRRAQAAESKVVKLERQIATTPVTKLRENAPLVKEIAVLRAQVEALAAPNATGSRRKSGRGGIQPTSASP